MWREIGGGLARRAAAVDPRRPSGGATPRRSKSASAASAPSARPRLRAHPLSPQVRSLAAQSDFWVLPLGCATIVPLFYYIVWHAPHIAPLHLALHAWGIGSVRASWAVYCSHALSHGRWRRQVGPFGGGRFNGVLAAVNLGTLFGILPSYWLFHRGHHMHLGTQSLHEARDRARAGKAQADGDLGIASRLFSPPSRKYSIAAGDGTAVRRVPESRFIASSLLVHLLAPFVFVGYITSAIGIRGDAPLRASLVTQAAASLAGWFAILAVSVARASAAPLLFVVGSQLLWLSPLNLNWLWTCPHLCEAGSSQPTVSFYTPRNTAGALLDAYMGYENYHVEHHDFPELPMYLLPKLRAIAPERYDHLRSMPALRPSTWRDAMREEYAYACQAA